MPRKRAPDIGRRYGSWVVLSERRYDRSRKYPHPIVDARCDCGYEQVVHFNNLASGLSRQCRSCGAKARTEKLRKPGRGTRLYKFWFSQKRNMCPAWKVSFDAFFADLGDPQPGMIPVRLDTRKPFGPGNWEWGTKTMMHGSRASELEGKTLSYWAAELGLTRERVRQLVNKAGDINAVLVDRGLRSVP